MNNISQKFIQCSNKSLSRINLQRAVVMVLYRNKQSEHKNSRRVCMGVWMYRKLCMWMIYSAKLDRDKIKKQIFLSSWLKFSVNSMKTTFIGQSHKKKCHLMWIFLGVLRRNDWEFFTIALKFFCLKLFSMTCDTSESYSYSYSNNWQPFL